MLADLKNYHTLHFCPENCLAFVILSKPMLNEQNFLLF